MENKYSHSKDDKMIEVGKLVEAFIKKNDRSPTTEEIQKIANEIGVGEYLFIGKEVADLSAEEYFKKMENNEIEGKPMFLSSKDSYKEN